MTNIIGLVVAFLLASNFAWSQAQYFDDSWQHGTGMITQTVSGDKVGIGTDALHPPGTLFSIGATDSGGSLTHNLFNIDLNGNIKTIGGLTCNINAVTVDLTSSGTIKFGNNGGTAGGNVDIHTQNSTGFITLSPGVSAVKVYVDGNGMSVGTGASPATGYALEINGAIKGAGFHSTSTVGGITSQYGINFDPTGNGTLMTMTYGRKIGINNLSPVGDLDLVGLFKTTQFQMASGAASGYVLTSDADGVGTWQAVTFTTNAESDGATKGIAAFNATNFLCASGICNTIQGISNSASPTFTGLTISGATASRPAIFNGSKALASGTYSGNTTTIATVSGSLTSGNLTKSDSSHNIVDAGVTIGTLTDGKLCQYTASGTVIDCTASAGGTGTVTSVATNSTLSGGTITTSGTLSINLSNANTWAGQQTFVAPILGAATGTSLALSGAIGQLGGSAGVTLSAATGALTIAGIGNTNNENLTFDFESNANKVAINSSTGVSSITLLSSAITFNTASSATGGTGMISIGSASASASSEVLVANFKITNSSTNTAAAATGGSMTGVKSGSTGGVSGTLIGVRGLAQYTSTGTQTDAYGVYGQAQKITSASGSITDAYSVYGDAPLASGGGTITNSWAGGFNGLVKLGTAGSVVGGLVFNNATSGTIKLQPVTGALGTVTLSLPATTDTLVGKTTTDTLTNKTLTAPVMTTPTLGVATATSIGATSGSLQITTAYVPKVVALTDGASISVDASLGNVYDVTLGGNRTMSAPSNATDGQVILFRIKQDGTGSRTITWNAIYHFTDTVPSPTLTTTAAHTDEIAFRYNGGITAWVAQGVNLNSV